MPDVPEDTPPDEIPPLGPLDARDYSRRTLLANERTYLAWWRTGLTTLTVALAAARVVPELSNAEDQWPYTVLGVGFALLGIVCVAYAEVRRRAVDSAVRRGEFAEPHALIMVGLSAGAVVLGAGLLVVVVVGP
jgi:putative membrane protein